MPRRSPAGEAGTARPLRHFEWWVPQWGDLHDRVIDEAARFLAMPILVDQAANQPVHVMGATSPELLFDVHRWRLFTVLLVNPDLAGRRQWISAAKHLNAPIPNGVVMRVIDPDRFNYQRTLVGAAT